MHGRGGKKHTSLNTSMTTLCFFRWLSNVSSPRYLSPNIIYKWLADVKSSHHDAKLPSNLILAGYLDITRCHIIFFFIMSYIINFPFTFFIY